MVSNPSNAVMIVLKKAWQQQRSEMLQAHALTIQHLQVYNSSESF
jgi:hypothetical protein